LIFIADLFDQGSQTSVLGAQSYFSICCSVFSISYVCKLEKQVFYAKAITFSNYFGMFSALEEI